MDAPRLTLARLAPAVVVAVLALADAAWAQTPAAGRSVHIVLVGDSTVTEGSGWGLGFRQLVAPGVTVTNTAQNGRSSKSFRDEGHWATALAPKGDYYLIQFGHNDQPGKGPERETDPSTTFPANIVFARLIVPASRRDRKVRGSNRRPRSMGAPGDAVWPMIGPP